MSSYSKCIWKLLVSLTYLFNPFIFLSWWLLYSQFLFSSLHDPRFELPSCRSIVTIVKLHQLAWLCTCLFFYNKLLQYFSILSKWLYKYYFFYKNITQINSVEIGRRLFFRYSNVFIFFCKHIKRRKPLKKID